MFNQPAALLQAMADREGTTLAALPQFWANLVSAGQARAYQEIVGALIGRGFTLAQITAWDEGLTFEKDMALYYASDARGQLAPGECASMNRYKQLAGVQVFIGGVWIQPGLPSPGQVMTGKIGRGDNFGPRGAFYEPHHDCDGW